MAHGLAAGWQRRCQRWLGNSRIDVGRIDGTLILWALQQWKNSSHSLHLALDTSMLRNRYRIVVISIVVHGRAIPLVWRTLVHPSAELLSWFDNQPRWTTMMRICSDTWINATAAPMGGEGRRLELPRAEHVEPATIRIICTSISASSILGSFSEYHRCIRWIRAIATRGEGRTGAFGVGPGAQGPLSRK